MPRAVDDNYVRQIVREFYNQKTPKKYVVQLPCKHARMELERPEDTCLQCPVCKNKFLYVHSMVNNRIYAAD